MIFSSFFCLLQGKEETKIDQIINYIEYVMIIKVIRIVIEMYHRFSGNTGLASAGPLFYQFIHFAG